MECKHCGEKTPGILESNHCWCNHCGVSMETQIQYVPSYNNIHSAPRQQIYCRAKRFTKFVQRTCMEKQEVMSHIQKIVDLYSSFEFIWGSHKKLTKRIYFFAKPVMLKHICDLLFIKSENLPCLKDKNREIDQISELKKLRKTLAWKLFYRDL